MEIGMKKNAVLCIIRSTDKLLLLKRTKEPHFGKYIPIGGRIEPFETPRNAAKREIHEETGLTIDKVKFCGVMVESSPTKFNWVNFIYLADTEQSTTPHECEEGILEWVEIQQIPKIPTPTTDMYIYKLVLEGQVFMFNAEYNDSVELVLLHDEITDRVLYKKS